MLRAVCLFALLAFTPVAFAPALYAAPEKYALGPESERQDGVPKGEVTKFEWKSEVFPGTIREYWVYVPQQYDKSKPAALMVFQDGHAYVGEKGQFRVPVVFDNLIHEGDMPPTIGVFINPGHKGDKLPESAWKANNRSFEYDTLSDQYARFLIDELLPEVGKQWNITADPEQRAICGISSGGICAWTVAWERPDSFRKVLSHVGSFTNIRGGHNCQVMVRKAERKPIRVFLQANEFDVDNEFGNWFLANQEMAAALRYKKYDVELVNGRGEHNGEFGGSILPLSLRWLWRKAE